MDMVSGGEGWPASLDPTFGSQLPKTRPCLIVSPDELNGKLRTLIIAPLTTGSRRAPFRVPAKFQGKDGVILPDQIRAIDRKRLVRRLGRAPAATLNATLAVLRELFGV